MAACKPWRDSTQLPSWLCPPTYARCSPTPTASLLTTRSSCMPLRLTVSREDLFVPKQTSRQKRFRAAFTAGGIAGNSLCTAGPREEQRRRPTATDGASTRAQGETFIDRSKLLSAWACAHAMSKHVPNHTASHTKTKNTPFTWVTALPPYAVSPAIGCLHRMSTGLNAHCRLLALVCIPVHPPTPCKFKGQTGLGGSNRGREIESETRCERGGHGSGACGP